MNSHFHLSRITTLSAYLETLQADFQTNLDEPEAQTGELITKAPPRSIHARLKPKRSTRIAQA